MTTFIGLYAVFGVTCMAFVTWHITPNLPKGVRIALTTCSLVIGAPATLAAYLCNKWEAED